MMQKKKTDEQKAMFNVYYKEYRQTDKFKAWKDNYQRTSVCAWRARNWHSYKRKSSDQLLSKTDFFAFVEANRSDLEALLSIKQERPEMSPVISKISDNPSWLADNIEIAPKALAAKRRELWRRLKRQISADQKSRAMKAYQAKQASLDKQISDMDTKETL